MKSMILFLIFVYSVKGFSSTLKIYFFDERKTKHIEVINFFEHKKGLYSSPLCKSSLDCKKYFSAENFTGSFHNSYSNPTHSLCLQVSGMPQFYYLDNDKNVRERCLLKDKQWVDLLVLWQWFNPKS